MKLAMVVSQTDPETVFNALRLANFSLDRGDEGNIFLLGEGVELDRIQDPNFDVRGQVESFVFSGGKIMACGTCLRLRNSQGSELCPVSTMKDLYEMIKDFDRVLTF